MIPAADKITIRTLKKRRDKAKRDLAIANNNLRFQLALTKQDSDASLSELGELLGVSRQRVHQILKGE